MSRVLVPLAQGFEETEAVAVIDVLRRAQVEVVIAGLEEGPVESAHGLRLIPDALLREVADQPFDAVFLPGGLGGTERLARSELVAQALRRAAEAGKLTTAICAAPTVLEQQGLLTNKRATSHASVKEMLGSAIYLEEEVVVDGTVVTSRGMGTAISMGLELVSMLVGQETAQQIARAIHYDE